MVGEASAGELAPTGGVFDRYPRVQITDKTANRKGKRLNRPILIIVGHSKLGAECGQQRVPQLRYLQHPGGSGSVELTDDVPEDFVRLRVRRDSHIEPLMQHHVVRQVVLKVSPALQQVRRSNSAGIGVPDELRTRLR